MQLLLLQQESDTQEKSSAAPMWKESYMQLKLVLEVKLTNISIIHRVRNLYKLILLIGGEYT